jgi:hypothetical protein
MTMLVSKQHKNAVKLWEYEFVEGRFRHAVLDQNHRLELRVVDDGFLARHSATQKRLLWLQQLFARSIYFGWVKDWARATAQGNSRELREYLLKRVTEGKVYIKTLNLQTDYYCFRLVHTDEIPPLVAFLQEKHEYHLFISQGEDPTVMTVTHLGTFPT